MTGEITLWHAYGTGSAEEKALTQALDAFKKENPDVKVNVLQIPFDQVFNKWETEVAAGGGPDMFTVPNDNTGNQVRAKLLAPVDDLIKGKTDGFAAVSVRRRDARRQAVRRAGHHQGRGAVLQQEHGAQSARRRPTNCWRWSRAARRSPSTRTTTTTSAG